MGFKQDDTVFTRVNRTSSDGESTIAAGSVGMVTVVGIGLEDGSTNGIEVLFEGKTYGHYKNTELVRTSGNSVFPPEDRPAELKKFRSDNPLALAIALVAGLHYPNTPIEDIYVVWFCATVQNWKALISTNVKDNSYYEVTHNGSKNETYVDKYIKVEHHTIHDDMLEKD